MISLSTRARVSLSLFIFSVLLLDGSSANAQKLLRWKLHPGETVHVRLSQKMTTEASVQGAVMQSTMDTEMLMKWYVLGVATDGTAEMTQSIDRVKIGVEMPGVGTVTYDSTSPEPPNDVAKSLAAGIEPLLGVSFVQKMNNRGEIIDVRLSEEGAKALDQAPSGAKLKEAFAEEGLKSLVSQATAVLPSRSVRPGDTWRGQSETTSPVGSLKMDIQYTYHGTESRNGTPLERIGVDLRMSFPEASNPLGLKVDVKEQDNSGVLYFDSARGRFVETQLHQKMVLETALGDRTHQQKLDTQLHMQFLTQRDLRSSEANRTATKRSRTRARSAAAPIRR